MWVKVAQAHIYWMTGLLDALLLFLYCCSSSKTSSSKDELTCNALGVEICIQSCLTGEKQVWVTLGHYDLLSSPSKLENYIKDQGSTYLFEPLLWKFILSQPYIGWINIKTYAQTNFPNP